MYIVLTAGGLMMLAVLWSVVAKRVAVAEAARARQEKRQKRRILSVGSSDDPVPVPAGRPKAQAFGRR